MTLPDLDGPTLDRVRADLALFGPALETLIARHHLRGAPIAFESGTAPAFAIGTRVVKLYAPAWPLDFAVEDAVLRRLEGSRVPAPRRIAGGALGAWRYLVMERVPGVPIETLLRDVSPPARRDAMRRLGETMAALHAMPTFALPSPVPDFDRLMARQRRVAEARATGVAGRFRAQLRPFLARVRPRPARRLLLHTEPGPGHVLASRCEDAIAIHGLIDFVEAMVGDPEYDLAVLAFFVAAGDRDALEAMLDGYGYPDAARGPDFARRCLRLLLLHRFGPLPWLMRRRPPRAQTLDALAEEWILGE